MDHYVCLQQLLKRFLSGDDRSKAFAGIIEGHLIEHLYEDDQFQDLLESLARYQPGGGDFLCEEQHLLPLMAEALQEVEKRLSEARK